jgi:hypothetical protein
MAVLTLRKLYYALDLVGVIHAGCDIGMGSDVLLGWLEMGI